MIPSGLCWQAPLAIVWFIGIVVAVSRWRSHPKISTAVLISIVCMLSAAVGQQVVFVLLDPPPGLSWSDFAIYFQITAAIVALVRAAGWAAILVAIFGWRGATNAGRTNPLQFSIRGLLVVTLVVAVLCGIIRGLTAILGESASILLTLLDEIPIAICWLFGGWTAWVRRRQHPSVSWFVAMAIGLQCGGLILSLAAMAWMLKFGPTNWLGPILMLVWLLTGPGSWILLLTSAFGWRTSKVGLPESPFRELPK
jgi:hypothetical protein